MVFSFFSSLLGLIFEPFKKYLAWKMLQRPHGLLHLFILLRFLPVLVSDFPDFVRFSYDKFVNKTQIRLELKKTRENISLS